MKEKQYDERDAFKLDITGGYYGRHVQAMTREKLHSKSDIAAELAHRDMIIDTLLEALTYGQTLNLPDMLDWVADRFVNVHGENSNLDFILSLRERARMSRAAINKALGETK